MDKAQYDKYQKDSADLALKAFERGDEKAFVAIVMSALTLPTPPETKPE